MGAQAAPHSPVLLEGIAEKAFKQPKNHPRLGIENGMGCRPSPPCQPHCNATQWQWGGCIACPSRCPHGEGGAGAAAQPAGAPPAAVATAPAAAAAQAAPPAALVETAAPAQLPAATSAAAGSQAEGQQVPATQTQHAPPAEQLAVAAEEAPPLPPTAAAPLAASSSALQVARRACDMQKWRADNLQPALEAS